MTAPKTDTRNAWHRGDVAGYYTYTDANGEVHATVEQQADKTIWRVFVDELAQGDYATLRDAKVAALKYSAPAPVLEDDLPAVDEVEGRPDAIDEANEDAAASVDDELDTWTERMPVLIRDLEAAMSDVAREMVVADLMHVAGLADRWNRRMAMRKVAATARRARKAQS